MKQPILITGAARSGTSMVAGIINICGAFGGKLAGPNHANEKGMFENVALRNLTKDYFEKIGVDRLGQYPLANGKELIIPTSWKREVQKIMYDEGYQDGHWFYKCPKMSHIWPVWDYAFPSAKWVIVRRKTPEIIHSCMNTKFMRAFSRPDVQKAVDVENEYDGWYWWVKQHEQRFVEMITAGLNCTVVWPARMVDGDYSKMKELIEWLGLEWKGEEIAAFIEPKLWKARQKV